MSLPSARDPGRSPFQVNVAWAFEAENQSKIAPVAGFLPDKSPSSFMKS